MRMTLLNRGATGALAMLLAAAALLACSLTLNAPSVTPTASIRPSPTTTDAPLVAGTAPSGQRATVVDVIDGDTIDVDVAGQVYRLRYIGIDTPERGEPFYEEASQANERLVLGREVVLVRDVSETDRFGRLLRYVYLEEGTFVNGELVARGFALAVTFPPDVAQQETLARLQREARERGAGLWAGVEMTPQVGAGPQVVIEYIYYDGVEGRNEPDEYALIANVGQEAVNLEGWRLNAGSGASAGSEQDFVFPSFELQPGQRCRVYTNKAQAEGCSFTFGSGRALWRNAGDCGRLFDVEGEEVAAYCY